MLKIPEFIYGTAWKEEQTKELTIKAVKSGFRAIDTANQKKHYREDYVGEALLELYKLGYQRQDIFLQSKYTYVMGQDHRLPYNPKDSFSKQVQDSFSNSLTQLHTDYIDSYILHGPSSSHRFQDCDWEVWATIEELFTSGQCKSIGISNVGPQQLLELINNSKIKPVFVQNRCFAQLGWDLQIRQICNKHNITYQGFSLLTANPEILMDQRVQELSKKYYVTTSQIIFRFCKHIQILPLTGTSSELHMKQDLEIMNIELTSSEVQMIEHLALD